MPFAPLPGKQLVSVAHNSCPCSMPLGQANRHHCGCRGELANAPQLKELVKAAHLQHYLLPLHVKDH
eukprot:12919431-Prorocentrum_lima.AAC.1